MKMSACIYLAARLAAQLRDGADDDAGRERAAAAGGDDAVAGEERHIVGETHTRCNL